jgi:hypothetical protein
MVLKIWFLVIISLLVMLFLGVVSGIENPISLITDKMTDEMADNLISQSYVPYYPDKSKMDYKRPNLFIGGILQWSPNADYADPMQTGFADQNGAIYIPTYYSTKTTLDSTGILDIIEVNKAANSEATDLNGLTRSELGANGPRTYGTIIGYSGGTTTVIEAMANQGVKTDTLILISPMTGNLINGKENFEKKIQAIITKNPNIKIVAIQSPDDHGVLDLGQYDFVGSKFDNEEFKDRVQIISKKGLNHEDIFRIYAMNNIKNGELVDPNINVPPMPEPNIFQKFAILVTNALEYIKTTLISYVPDSILTWISPWIDINPKTSSPTIESWNKTFGDGSSFSSAQQTTDGGYIATGTWKKTFGGSNTDTGVYSQQTSDGGYITVGTTCSYGSGVWLIKTDRNGNELWNRTFGHFFDVGKSVQQTIDGGYIIGGWTKGGSDIGRNIWLIKTDGDGNKLWDKTLTADSADEYLSVRQTTDAGYIMTSNMRTSISLGGVLLIKTDSSGNMLWEKTFGESYLDSGRSIQQTSDEGYIITGTYQPWSANYPQVWLIKTDPSGNMQWDKTFGDSSDFVAGNSVQQTNDGGYIIVGFRDSKTDYTNTDIWLIKTDFYGNKLWDKTFDRSKYDMGESVRQTSDDGYIISGWRVSSLDEYNRDLWLIKTDSNGNKLWDKTFTVNSDYTGDISVLQTSDGDYIITCSTRIGPDRNVLLIKTDSNGNV